MPDCAKSSSIQSSILSSTKYGEKLIQGEIKISLVKCPSLRSCAVGSNAIVGDASQTNKCAP
jgi:hypothetical protein